MKGGNEQAINQNELDYKPKALSSDSEAVLF